MKSSVEDQTPFGRKLAGDSFDPVLVVRSRSRATECDPLAKNMRCTVLQERLQPMSDGKRHFIVGYFLCYSYKLILISPGIFHRALFEKWLTLVAEKSPESAKFTYSNLEAFNVHPPSYVILILKKMPFFIILLYPLPDKSPHLAAENLNVELTPWGEGGG